MKKAKKNIYNKHKDYYKETEAMLRAYDYYKKAIDRNNARIEEIQKNGITEIIRGNNDGIKVQGGKREYKGLPEIEIEKIEYLNKENLKLEKRIIRVDNALMYIEDDIYYQVVILRYFNNMSIEDIAESLDVDKSTIARNRTRLVNELSYHLFPELTID